MRQPHHLTIQVLLILILYITPLVFVSLTVLSGLELFAIYTVFTVCLIIYYWSELYALTGDLLFLYGNKSRAKHIYIRAILDNTHSATVYLHYAMLLIEEENYEQALAHLYVAGSLSQLPYVYQGVMTHTAQCYYCLGLQHEQAGNLEQAKKYFDKSYSYDKNKTA